ncbi:LacI family DNA-binding transcriptional regulator [Halothermothrix orenii]|uniref:Transcriptional regulator, LacI family n=1 Tax=Halothermothrix orenii (strain H 168 / OCM 544 / DSM 9562) TaxID=373903 RepID=B8D051_HALOH|nr:LacI family DNA-binding transcriptional regulator [Halothermothrix orenii]ACL68805.1 transcriptional regulator, LacI family [Halothermothrix orenii H 168]
MPLTLKDIAKIAGVAESTVSRAINNKPGVGEETRKKILKIVEEYNFQPNKLAQGLAKKQTHILALLLPDLSNPNYPTIIKSIEEVANENGYQVVLCNTDNNPEKEKGYLELVERNQVDGAIVVGGELADRHILNLALNKNASLVLVNRLCEELTIPTVLVDSARGAYLATEHLIDQGISEIALIMGLDREFLESEKLEGYKQALTDNGIELNEKLIVQTEGSREAGYRAFLELMKKGVTPGGFFATSDLLAAGLVEAIKMGGYLIPEDFSVVGYGDSLVSSIITPPLTVVAEPLTRLGKLAARNLINLLNGKQPAEIIKVLNPSIKVRNSSTPHIKDK